MQGVLLVDKPAGWTSFDVVNYVRKMVAQAEGKKPKNVKVGHIGTLDPFATGLLVLLIGKEYTKRAGELSKLDKTYEVTAILGQVSSTGDPEGEIKPYQPVGRHHERSGSAAEGSILSGRSFAHAQDDREGAQDDSKRPTLEDIKAAAAAFVGEIEQIPPAFSAIKVNGQRAYKLARAGKQVVIDPRKVTINRLEIVSCSYPELKLVADVSSGTYIRTLVEDLGKALGTGAYTSELRRMHIGAYEIDDATEVKSLSVSNFQPH